MFFNTILNANFWILNRVIFYSKCRILSESQSSVNFYSQSKLLGGVAEFFSEAFLYRLLSENLPRPLCLFGTRSSSISLARWHPKNWFPPENSPSKYAAGAVTSGFGSIHSEMTESAAVFDAGRMEIRTDFSAACFLSLLPLCASLTFMHGKTWQL